MRYSSLQNRTSESSGACFAHCVFFFRKRIDSGNPSRLSTRDLVRLYSFCFESSLRLCWLSCSFCRRTSSAVQLISNCSFSSSCQPISNSDCRVSRRFSRSAMCLLKLLSSISFELASSALRSLSCCNASC